MGARLAEPDAAKADGADRELPSSKSIQVNAFGNQVSSSVCRGETEAGLPGEGIDLLLLDQSHLEIRLLRMRREGPNSMKVTIALQSATGHCPRFRSGGHGCRG